MTQFIEIFIIVTLFFAVFLRRDHGFHSCRNRIGQDIICVIAPVCQQGFRRNTLYQVDSFFTIRFQIPMIAFQKILCMAAAPR